MKNKEYPIPYELQEIFHEMVACYTIRDSLVTSSLPFALKRAIRVSKKAVKLHKRFWEEIYDLYPELRGKKAEFDTENNVVVLSKEDSNKFKIEFVYDNKVVYTLFNQGLPFTPFMGCKVKIGYLVYTVSKVIIMPEYGVVRVIMSSLMGSDSSKKEKQSSESGNTVVSEDNIEEVSIGGDKVIVFKEE